MGSPSPQYSSLILIVCSEVRGPGPGAELLPEPTLAQLMRDGWPVVVGAGVVKPDLRLLVGKEKFHRLSLAELRLSSSCLRLAIVVKVSTTPVISTITTISSPGDRGRLEAMSPSMTRMTGAVLP